MTSAALHVKQTCFFRAKGPSVRRLSLLQHPHLSPKPKDLRKPDFFSSVWYGILRSPDHQELTCYLRCKSKVTVGECEVPQSRCPQWRQLQAKSMGSAPNETETVLHHLKQAALQPPLFFPWMLLLSCRAALELPFSLLCQYLRLHVYR